MGPLPSRSLRRVEFVLDDSASGDAEGVGAADDFELTAGGDALKSTLGTTPGEEVEERIFRSGASHPTHRCQANLSGIPISTVPISTCRRPNKAAKYPRKQANL